MIKQLLFWIAKLKRPKRREVTEDGQFSGLRKDWKDARDFKYLGIAYPTTLPKQVSLRKYVLEVKNQGAIGSCAPHAFASCYEILRNIKNGTQVQTSERFLYYNVREYEGNLPKNAGTQMRTNAKLLQKQGISFEIFCPYSESLYNEEPSWKAQFAAGYQKISNYYFLDNIENIKKALAAKHPVAMSVQIFKNFYDCKGQVEEPNGTLQGGHAMAIIGYDEFTQRFEVLNSWGRNWADKGICWMPYTYLQKYGLDRGYANVVIEI